MSWYEDITANADDGVRRSGQRAITAAYPDGTRTIVTPCGCCSAKGWLRKRGYTVWLPAAVMANVAGELRPRWFA